MRSYLLVYRFAVINIVGLALLVAALFQGWIARLIAADPTGLVYVIFGVFVADTAGVFPRRRKRFAIVVICGHDNSTLRRSSMTPRIDRWTPSGAWVASITAAMGGKYNSFRDYPHVEARLRQHVSPAEAALALESLIRRDEFEPGPRIELFKELAGHFRGRAAFPDEATLGMTDEQYVRNVVDSIYNAGRVERKKHSA